ncbi:MAG: endonuclease/exonuclease/phosphatase family protein [Aestuariivirga sp.]
MALKNSRSNDTWPPEVIDHAAVAASRRRKRHREAGGAVFILLLGLAGLFAGRLGLLWSRFDLFAQFTIQFYILAAAGAVGLFCPRVKGLVAGIVAVMLVFGYGAWPSLVVPGVEKQLAAGETRLKVAQFNLGGERSDVDSIVASLKTLNADVVSLVEAQAERQDLLDKLKAQYPYQVNCFDQSGCEMAIVSKLPLSESKTIGAVPAAPIISASLGADYAGLVVIAVHTTRFPHITEQFTQFRYIAQALENKSGPLLVLGDFNATPQSRVLKEFAQRLGLKVNTYLPSWPATYGSPQLAIDHILTSSSLRALSAEEAGQSAGSDHLPIALVLGVAAQVK